MAKGKKYITSHEEFREWVSSLGYLFPSNEKELIRFNKFYSDYEHKLTGEEIDPEKLLDSMKAKVNTKIVDLEVQDQFTRSWRLVARNKKDINNAILLKMKNNQKKKNSSDK